MQSLWRAGTIFLGMAAAARHPLRLALVLGCVVGLVLFGSVGGWLSRQAQTSQKKYEGRDFNKTSQFDELPSKSAANPVAWQTNLAFAKTVLEGTLQKPADVSAAVRAANQALENLPDGSQVWFSLNGRSGVIAVAQLPGSNRTVQFNLSIPQFVQFLDVSKDDQFGKLMDTSAPAMLQRLAKAQSAAPQRAGAPTQTQPVTQPEEASSLSAVIDRLKQEEADKRMGITPDMSDEDKRKARDKARQENEWEMQALKLFPWMSQGDQRRAFVAAQRDKAAQRQNRVDIARANGNEESVFVKYRGHVDLTPFECTDITRSSFIDRVCYDRTNEYMLISLNGTFYHYCEIDAGTVSSLLNSPSMGSFYNASIKGAFDCRLHRMPSY
jgi:KTSC domain